MQENYKPNALETVPNKVSNADNEIIIYQPDSTVKLEVRLENETVWLTQQQIADLFGVKQPAISKHLKNIFDSGELDENSVHSILEYTASDGKHTRQSFIIWMPFFLLDTVSIAKCHGVQAMGKQGAERIFVTWL